MMVRLAKASFLVTLTAAALTLAQGSRGGPPQPGPFVAGDGATTKWTFDFGAARPNAGGEISGRAILRWKLRPRGTVELKVTCLEISASTATVGGKVIRRTGRRVAKRFRSATFFVRDGRLDKQPDGIGTLRLSRSASAACSKPSAQNLARVRSGDIAVDDGKP
jgi:hypothetical protein